jgi:hypothetical protein
LLGTCTSIKSDGVKRALWTQTSALVKWCGYPIIFSLS